MTTVEFYERTTWVLLPKLICCETSASKSCVGGSKEAPKPEHTGGTYRYRATSVLFKIPVLVYNLGAFSV